MAASYVKLGTGLEFITKDGVNIHVQQMLDGIFPQLLPLIVVLGTVSDGQAWCVASESDGIAAGHGGAWRRHGPVAG